VKEGGKKATKEGTPKNQVQVLERIRGRGGIGNRSFSRDWLNDSWSKRKSEGGSPAKEERGGEWKSKKRESPY